MDQQISAAEMRARGFSPEVIARQQQIESVRLLALPLISDIEREFDGIPRPAITLHVARGLDDEWFLTPERARELSALDLEQTWQEVSDESLGSFHGYFTFSDPEGWWFYLPAQMRYYLRHFPHGVDTVYWALCSTEAEENLSCLNSEQRALVSRFMAFCHEHDDLWPRTHLGDFHPRS